MTTTTTTTIAKVGKINFDNPFKFENLSAVATDIFLTAENTREIYLDLYEASKCFTPILARGYDLDGAAFHNLVKVVTMRAAGTAALICCEYHDDIEPQDINAAAEALITTIYDYAEDEARYMALDSK